MGILIWLAIGLGAGLLARALVPGRQRMGLVTTLLLGLAGSLLGGFVAAAISGDHSFATFEPVGLIGSVLGAVALLLIATAVITRRGQTPAPA